MIFYNNTARCAARFKEIYLENVVFFCLETTSEITHVSMSYDEVQARYSLFMQMIIIIHISTYICKWRRISFLEILINSHMGSDMS